MNWKKTKIADLCENVYSGGTPKSSIDEYYGGDIPWLRTQEVTFNRIGYTEKTITARGIANSSAKWVPADSVIVAMYGASAGRVAINKIPLTTNQACCNLVTDPQKVDYRFLYYSLSAASKSLGGLSKGAAQRNLNGGIIKSFEIGAPPLSVQKRIADILSVFDDLIEVNRQRIERLERAARLLYREWFVHHRFPGHEHTAIIDGVPEGWKEQSFSELADFINGYAFGPDDKGEEGLPIIKIPELRDGVTESTPRNPGNLIKEKYHVMRGDILFSWSGSFVVTLWNAESGLLNQHLFRVLPPQKEIKHFLLNALQENINSFLQQSTGSTMKHIRRSALDNVSVAVPPPSMLGEFDDIVSPMYEQVLCLHAQNDRLKRTRDILLPRLMSGEITV